jgi:hypothetical protein
MFGWIGEHVVLLLLVGCGLVLLLGSTTVLCVRRLRRRSSVKYTVLKQVD